MNKILRVVLDQNDLCAVKFIHKGSQYIIFSFFLYCDTDFAGDAVYSISAQQPLNI